jgi:hypothetical protein
VFYALDCLHPAQNLAGVDRLPESPQVRVEEGQPAVGGEAGGELLLQEKAQVLGPIIRARTERDVYFERHE